MGIFGRFTLRSLARNRVRTAVSIVGIALSCALLTAVLTSVVSLSTMLLERTGADEGWWYAEVADVGKDGLDRLAGKPDVTDWTGIADLGAASLGDKNSDVFGRYLYAKTWPAEQDGSEPLVQEPELVAGRAPEAAGEIVLPHYLQNAELEPCGVDTAGGGAIKLGSSVTLELGTRTLTDDKSGTSRVATSMDGDVMADTAQSETYAQNLGSVTGTVVGFYRSYGISSTYAMQGNSAYVYDDGTALERVLTDGSDATWVSVLFRTGNPADAERAADDIVQETSCGPHAAARAHTSLLRWMGVTPGTAIWNTLYWIAGILAAVIIVAGVSLVYNAFAISVAERTRQFGLLASLGASKRQLRRTVLTEALVLGAAGIPLGLALGLAGCYAVFWFTGEGLASMLGAAEAGAAVNVRVVVSAPVLALAALLALVTLLASAWIPALRAGRVSAVDAIRQAQDVRLSRRGRRALRRAARRGRRAGTAGHLAEKDVRLRGIAARLFGVPGFVAHRNLTRSTSKGRVTVAALAVSVALLIISGSIGATLEYASGTALDTMEGQDLLLTVDATGAGADQSLALADGKVDGPGMQKALARFYADARGVAGAEANGYTTTYLAEMILSANMASDDMGSFDPTGARLSGGRWYGSAYVEFVDDASWNDYVRALGLSRDEFCDPAHPKAIAVNGYNAKSDGSYAHWKPLAKTGTAESIEFVDLDGSFFSAVQDGPSGEPEASYCDEDGNERTMPLDEAVARKTSIEVGALADSAPACVDSSDGTLQIILPASAIELADTMGYSYANMSFSTDGDAARASDAQDALEAISSEHPELDVMYVNVAGSKLQARLMTDTINTFIYCFAVVCGLIAVANVFNTLTNSLMLRQREFAVLKSVGMGNRAFRGMIAYECASYAVRGFAVGFVIALAAAVGLYQSMALSYATYEFGLPWLQIGISAAVIVAVILASVAFALHQARSSSIVDALRADAL